MIQSNIGYNMFHGSRKLMTSVIVDESSFCYNPQDCYYRHVHGHSKFTLYKDEETVKEGLVRLDKPSLFPLGNYSKQCQGDYLVAAGSIGDLFTNFNDVCIIEEEVFDEPTLKRICTNVDTCNKIQGTVAYVY